MVIDENTRLIFENICHRVLNKFRDSLNDDKFKPLQDEDAKLHKRISDLNDKSESKNMELRKEIDSDMKEFAKDIKSEFHDVRRENKQTRAMLWAIVVGLLLLLAKAAFGG